MKWVPETIHLTVLVMDIPEDNDLSYRQCRNNECGSESFIRNPWFYDNRVSVMWPSPIVYPWMTNVGFWIFRYNKEETHLNDLRDMFIFRASPRALAPSSDIPLWKRLERRHMHSFLIGNCRHAAKCIHMEVKSMHVLWRVSTYFIDNSNCMYCDMYPSVYRQNPSQPR